MPLSQRNLIPLESSKYFVEALVDRATNHEAAAPRALRQLSKPSRGVKARVTEYRYPILPLQPRFHEVRIDVMSNLNCAALRAKLVKI